MSTLIDIESYIRRLIVRSYSRAKMLVEREGRPLPARWIFFRIRKYVDSFLRGSRENRLILIPGLRGVGKTTLLWQLYKFLVERRNVDPRNILVLPADELKLLNANIWMALQAYEKVLETTFESLDKDVFIFIDEATFDPNWHLAVKASIYDKTDRIFTIVTGSSALGLRITTDLARRSSIERMYPLNYAEYLMLRFGLKPPRSFTSRLREAIFEASSAKEAYSHLKTLDNDLMSLQLSLEEVDLKNHLGYFLKVGGLPFSAMEGESSLPKVYEVIERVIFHDLPALYNFDRETCEGALKFLALLSTRHPEKIAISNMSKAVGLSRQVMSNIVNALVNAEIIFPVLPHERGSSLVRKPKKYYFTTSVLRAALLLNLGWSVEEEDVLGALLEDAVASSLHRLTHTYVLTGMHYPSQGADIIAVIRHGETSQKIIPIEVSWGIKDKKQILKTISALKAPYGIIVDGSESPRFEDKVVWVPRHVFLLM